jgi:CubicO group peptidase (beta-lactamase class C family)
MLSEPEAQELLRVVAAASVRAEPSRSSAVGVVARGRRPVVQAAAADAEADDLGAIAVPVHSLTKVMTAFLTLRLVEQGVVDLDAPVGRYLPDVTFTTRRRAARGRVTVRRLLCHTSGISARDADDTQWAGAGRYSGNIACAWPPGSRYWYSNHNYGLLVDALERATLVPYETLVRTHVLEPLGLCSTGFAVPGGGPGGGGASTGTDVDGRLAGTLGAHSTVGDLLALGAAVMGFGEQAGLLSDASRALFVARRTPVCFRERDLFGIPLFWQHGYSEHTSATMQLVGLRDEPAVVVAISRSHTVRLVDRQADLVVRRDYGLPGPADEMPRGDGHLGRLFWPAYEGSYVPHRVHDGRDDYSIRVFTQDERLWLLVRKEGTPDRTEALAQRSPGDPTAFKVDSRKFGFGFGHGLSPCTIRFRVGRGRTCTLEVEDLVFFDRVVDTTAARDRARDWTRRVVLHCWSAAIRLRQRAADRRPVEGLPPTALRGRGRA